MSTDLSETSGTTAGDPSAAAADEPLLRATGIQKYFATETGLLDRFFGEPQYVKAVDGVDLAVGERETLGLVGESGCGKTTLGRVLSRLYDPSAGTLEFDGDDITGLSGDGLKRLRKRVQVIFQDPMSSLNPRKTAGEIVGKPLEVHDIAAGDAKRDRLVELFDEVGLQESHLDRYPHEFSGGQRQRIGIARALAVEPDLIIADEPVSALDVSVQAQIINLMKRLQDKYGLSYVFIAHDLSVVKHISDRVAVMYLGQIVERGRKEDIFGNPQHPYTRSLLHSIPRVDGDRKRHESLLEGNPPSPIDPPSGCRFRTRCPEYLGDECADAEPQLQAVAGASGTVEPPDRVETISTDGESSDEHAVACHWLDKSGERRASQDPMS